MSLLRSAKRSANTDPENETQELQAIRARILQLVLIAASFLGAAALFSNLPNLIREEAWVVAGIQSFAYLATLFITINSRLSYNFRSFGLVSFIFLLGVSDLVRTGLAGEGRLFFLTFVILALALMRFRTGIQMFSLSVVTLIVIAWLILSGHIPVPPLQPSDDSSKLGGWITGGLIYGMLASLLIYSIYTLMHGLQNTLKKEKELMAVVEEERGRLEQRVIERTSALEKRTNYLEVASQFGQEIIALTSLDKVLETATHYFHDPLGFANVAVFIQEGGEYYAIKMAAGETASAMLAQQQKLSPTLPGSLGELIAKGEMRLLHNAGLDAQYFKETLLVNVPSAVLLPIRGTSEVIGAVLLLVSAEMDVMIDDLHIYQSMTDQMGVTLDKVRVMNILEKNVEDLRATNKQAVQQSWRTYFRNGRHNYAFSSQARLSSGSARSNQANKALHEGKRVVSAAEIQEDGNPITTLAIPIVLRDQPLGVIDIRFAGQTVSSDIINLIESTTNRLALAIENARLMEEMGQRAEREHLVSDISSKVRASSDIDSILKVAAVEIGRSLGVSEVLVQLRSDQ